MVTSPITNTRGVSALQMHIKERLVPIIHVNSGDVVRIARRRRRALTIFIMRPGDAARGMS